MLSYLKTHKFDPIITTLSFFVLLLGFVIFFSASLGVMARYEEKFYGIIQNQFLFGICFGSIAYFVGAYIPRNFIKNISPFILVIALVLCTAVLFPTVGFMHGGARRWISIFSFSFQPSEILKYATILFLGWFNFNFWSKLKDDGWRVTPILLLFLSLILILKEPDFGTTTIIASGIAAAFFCTSAKIKDLVIIILLGGLASVIFYFTFSHAQNRINTFLNPSENLQSQSYQAKQTAISLGSGGLLGDGYGKSLQKYYHLPEPVGDSIFAVIGEEFGFVGTIFVLLIIFILGLRLILLSTYIRDPFSKSVLVGTGTIILAQTFLNAASSSGAIPFTGVPLPLISHGSTSIIITMAMLGLCSQLGIHRIIQK